MMFVKRAAVWIASSVVTVGVLFVAINVMGGSTIGEAVSFFVQMLKRPAVVGAVAPTSEMAASAMVAHIPKVPGIDRHIIEVGAGTGSITKELVKQLQPGDTLDLVELDEGLADILVKRFGTHPQINVLQMSITDWRPAYKYDAMVMSVPFNALPIGITKSIWEHCLQLLKPGATTSYISYMLFPHIKEFLLQGKEKENYRANRQFMADLRKKYLSGHVEIMANLPPADVFYLTFS